MEESMQEVKFSAENPEMCSICQENMTVGRKLVECPHVFHYYCIAQLIQKGGDKCPMCRAKIV